MTKNTKLLIIGGIGLAAGTALSLAFPDAGELPGTAMMLILCLSAALCGASVPGVIQLNSKPIRAAGAAVFFVLPWMVEPPVLGGDPGEPQEHTASGAASGTGAEPAPPAPAGTGTTAGVTPGREPVPAPPGGRPKPGTGTRTTGTVSGDATKAPSKRKVTRPRTIFDGLLKRSG